MNSIVAAAVAECEEKTDGSEYEKALWLHDWLLQQLDYDNSLKWSSSESALTRKLGTCQAYESAYSKLLTAADIENAETRDEVEIDSSNVSTIYDIEPDKNNKRKDIDFIAQRTRFYHAIIDSRSLKSGQSYDKLKKVFVIFICPYDPFGDDRMIYTIRNHCVENPELPYGYFHRKYVTSGSDLL